MKKIVIFIVLLSVLGACNDDFLDQVPEDRLTFDDTFSKRNTVEQYLANIYSKIPNEKFQLFAPQSNAGIWIAGSDEADNTFSWSRANNFNSGDWNADTDIVRVLWNNSYQAIRASTTFLLNADQCGDCTAERIKQYKAEARVLRAFFYYQIIRNWGPAILMGDVAYDANSDISKLKRNSFDECAAYIVSELDSAAADLVGISHTNGNAGRMSRPFALAIKERTLLLAASPLFNGNTDYADFKGKDGEVLINQTYQAAKWAAAATAAKNFIDEFVPGTFDLYTENDGNGNYSPYLSLRNVFSKEWNKEIIYAIPRGADTYSYMTTPAHTGSVEEVRGSGGLGVTQEMVDSYFMSNGRKIDDAGSGYVTSGFSNFQAPYDSQSRSTFNQWVNREPRFYVGVTYNNSLWLNRDFGNLVTTTWYFGNSGIANGADNHPSTGYIVRKDAPLGDRRNTARSQVMIRLAEIYLDYVEALNESNPGNPDILIYLNKIRKRAGIAEYGSTDLAAPGNQIAMRDAIHRERKVELAFENIRYFDVKRWKMAKTLFSGTFHGMDINAKDVANFYNKIDLENRIFQDKHYLWPVPQYELNADRDLTQNPGW